MDIKKRPVDWECVNYMVCEVQYGGKITDDWDRRLFNTYGQAWLVPAILDAQFRFHEGYQIPQGAEVDAFRKAIETLPLIDNTNLFGLHPNADIAFRTRQTSMVTSTMLDPIPLYLREISLTSSLQLPYTFPLYLTGHLDDARDAAQGGRRRRRRDARGGSAQDRARAAGEA